VKIALVCSDRGPVPPIRGGAIQLLIHKVAPILAKKHHVTVFSVTDERLDPVERINGVLFIRYAKEKYLEHICQYLQAHRFDVIEVFNRPQFVPLIAAASPRSKIVLSMHNIVFGTSAVDDTTAKRAIACSNKIVTVSRFVAKDIAKKYPQAKDKVKTIYSGVDINEYEPIYSKKGRQTASKIRKLLNIPEDAFVLLYVGRLVPYKGCHMVIQAMKHVLGKYSNTHLVIVGSKWYGENGESDYVKKLRRLAEPHRDRIHFTQYVPVQSVPQYFTSANIFICASQWKEPLARVHYEAMAAGLPIISTKRGGNPEVMTSGKNGIVIKDPKDPKALAEAIKYLLKNKSLRQKMSRNGRALAVKKYNFARVAKDLESVFKTPGGNRRTKRV
jgi:spore coat protein SA